jgi:hypothetical protein
MVIEGNRQMTNNFHAVLMGVREAAANASGARDVLIARIAAASEGASGGQIKEINREVLIGSIASKVARAAGRDLIPEDFGTAAIILEKKGATSKKGPKRSAEEQRWFSAATTFLSTLYGAAKVATPTSEVRKAAGKESAKKRAARQGTNATPAADNATPAAGSTTPRGNLARAAGAKNTAGEVISAAMGYAAAIKTLAEVNAKLIGKARAATLNRAAAVILKMEMPT